MIGKSKILITVTISTLLTGVILWVFWGPTADEEAHWQTVRVQEQPFRASISARATLLPRHEVNVQSPIAGRVESIEVREGQTVKKGEILAWMSSVERAALLDAARAEGPKSLARWRRVYRPTPIVSPINGTVIVANTVQGQSINSTTPLFTVADELIGLAKVDEADIRFVKMKQPVELKLDAFPDQVFPGHVEHISYTTTVEDGINVFAVRIALTKSRPDLRSGMNATAHFFHRINERARVLPTWMAKGFENTRVELMVKGPEGKPVLRSVEVGANNGRWIEVLGDLDVNDVIFYRESRIFNEAKGFQLFRRKAKQ